MHLLCSTPSCPPELAQALQAARGVTEALQPCRQLSFEAGRSVTLSRCAASGRMLVVKSQPRHDPVELQQVLTEVAVHSALTPSPHICPLLAAAQDSRQVVLVLEHANGGTLREQMECLMDEQRLRDWVARPLLQALAVLQEQGVVHRDVKPENVLVHNGQLLLADFGLAATVAADPPCCSRACTDTVGQACDSSSAGISFTRGAVSSRGSSRRCSCDGVESCSEGGEGCEGSGSDASACCSSGSSSMAATPASCSSCPSPCGRQPHRSHHTTTTNHSSRGRSSMDTTLPLPASAQGSACLAPEVVAAAAAPSDASLAACGTPMYTAPEVLLAMFRSQPLRPVVTPRNDVWSLGLMLLEAATGQHPFSEEACMAGGGNVMYNVAFHKAVALPDSLGPQLKDFLRQMLQRDPERRPTARQMLRHPWLCSDASAAQALDAKRPASPQQMRDRAMSASGLPSSTSMGAVDCGTLNGTAAEAGGDGARRGCEAGVGVARCISNGALLSSHPASGQPDGEQQQHGRQAEGARHAAGAGLQVLGRQTHCGLLHALSDPSVSLLQPERLMAAAAAGMTAAPSRLGAAQGGRALQAPELPAAQSSAFEMALCWED